jgi:2-oxoglutarate ferredoxin oxidoreductase subunit beta
MRRGVNMVYIVENNGVYGLTKGQFSATADKGSKSKKGVVNTDDAHRLVSAGAAAGRHLRRAQLLRRQGPAGAADQGAIAHKGAAFIDVISPCVAFNNHAGSTKSYDYVREHNEAVNRIDFITSEREEITADYAPGEVVIDMSSTTAPCCACARRIHARGPISA